MNNLNKFYTKAEIAEKCFELIKPFLEETDNFIEPSAGSGVFIDVIKKNNFNVVGYDIQPDRNDIIQQDFFKLELKEKNICFLGNPPFGYKGRIAIDFINKSLPYSKFVGFILPYTLTKFSAQKKIINEAFLILNEELPINSFIENEKEFSVKCIFQIWSLNNFGKEDIRTRKRLPVKSNDFVFYRHNATEETKKYLYFDWKIAIYAQGRKDYNKIFTKKDFDFLKERINNSSDQFYFFNGTDEIINNLKNINWEELSKKSSVITPGFSKTDIIKEYNSIYGKRE